MNKAIALSLIVLSGCGGSDGSGSGAAATPTPANNVTATSIMKVVSGNGCGKSDTGIAGLTINYYYQNDLLESGDRFVSCWIAGSTSQYAGSYLYKAGSNGATNGYCSVVSDIDAASSGYWSFTTSNGIATVKYNDVGSTHNGYVYTFATADCTNY